MARVKYSDKPFKIAAEALLSRLSLTLEKLGIKVSEDVLTKALRTHSTKELQLVAEKSAKDLALLQRTQQPVYLSGVGFPSNEITSIEGRFASRVSAASEKSTQARMSSRNVYAPDRKLPRSQRTAEPLPDTDAPHTQLGSKQGRNGNYPQAREFDAQGKPVRDIDFTDHGRAHNHPNPHQHIYTENPSGGTKCRVLAPVIK